MIHLLHDNNNWNARLIARAMEAAHGKWDFLFSEPEASCLFALLLCHKIHDCGQTKVEWVVVKSAWCSSLRQAAFLLFLLVNIWSRIVAMLSQFVAIYSLQIESRSSGCELLDLPSCNWIRSCDRPVPTSRKSRLQGLHGKISKLIH